MITETALVECSLLPAFSNNEQFKCLFYLYAMFRNHRSSYFVVIAASADQLTLLRSFHESMSRFHRGSYNEYVLPSENTKDVRPDPHKNLIWCIERDLVACGLRFIVLNAPNVIGYYYV